MRHNFTFSGDYLRKKDGSILNLVYSPDGIDGKKAFYEYESNGILKETKHPLLLYSLLKSKASTNFHIKLYAKDRANYFLSKNELDEIYKEINPPKWFKESVDNWTIKLRANERV